MCSALTMYLESSVQTVLFFLLAFYTFSATSSVNDNLIEKTQFEAAFQAIIQEIKCAVFPDPELVARECSICGIPRSDILIPHNDAIPCIASHRLFAAVLAI
ncbi:hypothetical protein LSTR_LSTR000674 [Laodelphax striatellus]|uniref:Uncharacterized protein n=1 Tax=Laodelphax striatellus TaxID=195883 RepID=A0A482XG59_LAOST|nr:hypothetical protein LSTR_LSTR000674 [Laodelphax striatellus]